jgi:Kef-type K+ transport system membrane component KefB
MSLSSIEIFHVLAAIAALVAVAHAGGLLAMRLGLPAMVGELGGGLLLGATVFERLAPGAHGWLLDPAASGSGTVHPVQPILGIIGQFGLFFLMFLGGLQLKQLMTRKDTRAIAWIASLGVIIPVAAGVVILMLVDFSEYVGTAESERALNIVLVTALAVTSIPVITRIFMDLDLMETRLARIVLAVAVLEDVLLYIAVSIAIGIANAKAKADASIPAQLGLDPESFLFLAWHVGASLLLLVVATVGFRLQRDWTVRAPNPIARRSPVGWTVAFIMIVILIAQLLGLAPMFGALVAGIAASSDLRPAFVIARQQIEGFAQGFFIPLYFATIGVALDLVNDLDLAFTLGLLVVGTVLKYSGSLLGAKIAGEPKAMAHTLAISVNARGGPGIVLATTAFGAGIINEEAFTALIVLAIGTSVAAGAWLAHISRAHPNAMKLIRGEVPPDPTTPAAPPLAAP